MDKRVWQVKLAGSWKDYAEAEQYQIDQCFRSGYQHVRYKARGGQLYVVNFDTMMQSNLGSNKQRPIRIAPAPQAATMAPQVVPPPVFVQPQVIPNAPVAHPNGAGVQLIDIDGTGKADAVMVETTGDGVFDTQVMLSGANAGQAQSATGAYPSAPPPQDQSPSAAASQPASQPPAVMTMSAPVKPEEPQKVNETCCCGMKCCGLTTAGLVVIPCCAFLGYFIGDNADIIIDAAGNAAAAV